MEWLFWLLELTSIGARLLREAILIIRMSIITLNGHLVEDSARLSTLDLLQAKPSLLLLCSRGILKLARLYLEVLLYIIPIHVSFNLYLVFVFDQLVMIFFILLFPV